MKPKADTDDWYPNLSSTVRQGGRMRNNEKGIVSWIVIGVVWGIFMGVAATFRFLETDKGAKVLSESKKVQAVTPTEDTTKPPWSRP